GAAGSAYDSRAATVLDSRASSRDGVGELSLWFAKLNRSLKLPALDADAPRHESRLSLGRRGAAPGWGFAVASRIGDVPHARMEAAVMRVQSGWHGYRWRRAPCAERLRGSSSCWVASWSLLARAPTARAPAKTSTTPRSPRARHNSRPAKSRQNI